MGKLGDILDQKETDPNEAEASNADEVPPGEYHVQVEDAEVKKTNDGSGTYLDLDCKILGPKYETFHLFHNITLQNDNETAVEIGDRQLKALSMACGFDQVVRDEDELIGKEFIAKSGADFDEYQGEPQVYTGIKSFKQLKGTPSGPFNEEQFKEEVQQHLHGAGSTGTDDDSFDDDDIPF